MIKASALTEEGRRPRHFSGEPACTGDLGATARAAFSFCCLDKLSLEEGEAEDTATRGCTTMVVTSFSFPDTAATALEPRVGMRL